MSFSSLVQNYGNHIQNVVLLKSRWGSEVGGQLECCILLHKLDKHRRTGNLRDMAKYMALYIREGFANRYGVPKRARGWAIEAGLKKSKTNGVGYPHKDGSYHWFAT
jgi:hypothetical protein